MATMQVAHQPAIVRAIGLRAWVDALFILSQADSQREGCTVTRVHLPGSLPMLLAKRCLLHTLVIGVAAVALTMSSNYRSRRVVPSPSGPQTMKEVIAIAEKMGLHYRSDQQDGTVYVRLTISEAPLAWDRANALVLNPRNKSAWNGTVVVFCRVWNEGQTVSDDRYEVWGEFLLYGDPSLIKRLTATATSEESMGH